GGIRHLRRILPRAAAPSGAHMNTPRHRARPRSSRALSARPRYIKTLMTWETIRNLVRDEWVILSLLLLWSLAGLTVICERVYSLWNVIPKSMAFKNK